MLNQCTFIGRLTSDPELKYTGQGTAYTKFSIALDRWNGDGADFPRIVCFKKQAENVAQYCVKGSLVNICCSVQTGSYDDNDGKKVYTTDFIANRVKFLDNKKKGDQQDQRPNDNFSYGIDPSEFQAIEDDDDIPHFNHIGA